MSAHSEALFWRARQKPTFDLARYRCSEGDNTEYELTTSGAALPRIAGTRRSPGHAPIAPESAATLSDSRGVGRLREYGAPSSGLPVQLGAPLLFGIAEVVLGALLYAGTAAAIIFAFILFAP